MLQRFKEMPTHKQPLAWRGQLIFFIGDNSNNMRAINDFANVTANTGDFSKPTAGGYCIEILSVKDVPMNASTGKGDYLMMDYDIAHGDFCGYYGKQNKRFGGNWIANFIRSYKDNCAGMFKHFINCIEESNIGYKWNWDENTLIGKFVGVVLQEEEYRKNDGSIGTRLKVKDIKTTKQIVSGDFKVPEKKKLDDSSSNLATPKFEPINDEDIPF